MAHPAVPDLVSFFYPIGNTPAVCLTRDIPREIPAKILLLGCGDVRNVLYTCYVDRETSRQLDITSCDIQPAVIARNICLLSLVLDSKNNDKSRSCDLFSSQLNWDSRLTHLLQLNPSGISTIISTSTSPRSTFLVSMPRNLSLWENLSRPGKPANTVLCFDSVTCPRSQRLWEFGKDISSRTKRHARSSVPSSRATLERVRMQRSG